jgi:hypothetical protein
MIPIFYASTSSHNISRLLVLIATYLLSGTLWILSLCYALFLLMPDNEYFILSNITYGIYLGGYFYDPALVILFDFSDADLMRCSYLEKYCISFQLVVLSGIMC